MGTGGISPEELGPAASPTSLFSKIRMGYLFNFLIGTLRENTEIICSGMMMAAAVQISLYHPVFQNTNPNPTRTLLIIMTKSVMNQMVPTFF